MDVSGPTLYRRIEPLVDANLLEERQRIDEDGTQPKQYETILDGVTFIIEDRRYTVDIKIDPDFADDVESIRAELD